jgi:hypothetical protein
VNVRRTARTFLVTAAAASLLLIASRQAMTQENSVQASESANAYGYYSADGSYYVPNVYPRWTIHYGPFWCTSGYSYYRPLQPNDWGYGPHGPRHNLNASQKSPSGMTWW